MSSELVIGLVGAIGTDLSTIHRIISERLTNNFQYKNELIKISKDVIPVLSRDKSTPTENYGRYEKLINEGNHLRETTKDKSFLAKAAVAHINWKRKSDQQPLERTAFIISSLKNPEEVQCLREIYSSGFFLIGVFSDKERRYKHLTHHLKMTPGEANSLIDRDTDESNEFGQHTRDTYHLSDFFVSFSGNTDKLTNDICRLLDIIFGSPFITPTFDEFAMFMAFSSSLRSADLSRQVGAVITKENNIVSTGANDIPKAGGGLYWPKYSESTNEIVDALNGRDYMRGHDSNVTERNEIIDNILSKLDDSIKEDVVKALKASKLKDITEYGRVVHAEMEAILASARLGISTSGAYLYCTTFPCHNCAKHIIASGINRVFYVEPYPKSKAIEFHSDAIEEVTSMQRDVNKVSFEPFVGVGPRSFFDLFSTGMSSGYPIKRKTASGHAVQWNPATADIRVPLKPNSYIEREKIAASQVSQAAPPEK